MHISTCDLRLFESGVAGIVASPFLDDRLFLERLALLVRFEWRAHADPDPV